MKILNDFNIEALNSKFADSEPRLILEYSILNLFKNKIAYVCSFGAESAIILHLSLKLVRIFYNNLKHIFIWET